MNNICVLFLHHNLNEVVIQNFNSFNYNNNNIIALKDSDTEGLENSISIPIDNQQIPRGDRWTSSDTVYFNYILNNQNTLKYSHYMLCEYDSYCECNLNLIFEKYFKYDLVFPKKISFFDDPNWKWFKIIENNNIEKDKLIGFRPFTFLLISREAIIKIANFYKNNWEFLENTNNEARLGIISELLNLNTSQIYNDFNNLEWFPIRFKKNFKFYHPIKKIINQDTFMKDPIPSNHNYGLWEFGEFYTNEKHSRKVLYLQSNGIINHSNHHHECFWGEEDNSTIFYDIKGSISIKFHLVDSQYIGDFYKMNLENTIERKNAYWIKKIS
jgi:hypothetical protein